jgi:hypothetical protein
LTLPLPEKITIPLSSLSSRLAMKMITKFCKESLENQLYSWNVVNTGIHRFSSYSVLKEQGISFPKQPIQTKVAHDLCFFHLRSFRLDHKLNRIANGLYPNITKKTAIFCIKRRFKYGVIICLCIYRKPSIKNRSDGPARIKNFLPSVS